MKSKRNDLVWNTIGTTLNAFNSLFFLVIVKRINGINDAGIFTFAFSMGCLLYIVGIYSGRVFQITDDNKKHDDISYLNVHFITTISMIIIAVIYCLLRKYKLYKLLVILLLTSLKALEALSDTFHAIMQKNNELYKVGISLTAKAILGVTLFFLIDYITKNLIYSIETILIVNLIILIFYDIKQAKIKRKYFFDKKIVFDIFKYGFYAFLFTFLNLFLISIQKYAIDFYSTNKIQTIFGIIIMPTTVISLVAQFAIHPFILEINDSVKKANFQNLNKIIIKLCSFVVLFTIFAIIGAWFLGIPVLNVIYAVKLERYKVDLIIILIGAMLYALTTIFSNTLISLKRTKSQAIIYAIISLLSIIISINLVKNYGINGAVYSYLCSMFLLFTSFLIHIVKVINKEKK